MTPSPCFRATEVIRDILIVKMPKQLIKIEMERDSLQQKWGITIQGGADLSLTAKVASVKVSEKNSASKSSIRRFVITEKALTRPFSWLKVVTTAFTFKTLLRHYAKWALTPRSLNVKLGPRRNYHKGRAAIRHYANQTTRFA